MSFGDTFENDLLKLLFNASAIANIADNAASSPLTALYCGLHTASPGEAGSQNTNECTYTPYTRVAVNRNTGGWTVTANSVSPVNDINFPTCTVGSQTATYASIGTALSGAGKLILYGALTPTIAIAPTVPPVLVQSTTITLD